MHFVICYDIENDRLRARTAKILERHGCHRVQRSVFVAPYLERKHLVRLRGALKQCYARQPLSPDDSLLLVPLREEYVADIEVLGVNNIITALAEKPLKIML
ncbi:MAG: CRISPR-associated endonuclease Cas2 [Saprospiraceae bacterium]|nr:CRISPR-associated endonuclease Cas2 [Saprospiraceae bacterium]